MKKTEYAFQVSETIYLIPIYRRIWEQDGRYYIKSEGKLFDVTDKQEYWHRSPVNIPK